jgi:CubicO group peptidase (beta-lactamase class C family)
MKYLFCFLMMSLNYAHASEWANVNSILKTGLSDKLFSGASLYVGNNQVALDQHSVGDSDAGKIYDIASLTKVVVTTTAVMMLIERGELSLSDKVSKFFPEFVGGDKELVTIEDLMRHRSGLASGSKVNESEALDAYLKRVCSNELSYRPLSKTVYSDLSFILLGRVVEMVSGVALADFAQQNIFTPLKMLNSSFKVASAHQLRCAPTSAARDCQVHDPTAFHFLPVSVGNAGLFSNLEDLSRFGRMILAGGELDGVRILTKQSVSKMTTASGPRGLGWDFTSEFSTAPRGEVFPLGVSFGHTGYTGTTLWIDPQSQTFYLFLSNRVFMGDERTKKPFSEFRKKLSTAIGKKVYSSP